MSSAIAVTNSTFQKEVIESEVPVIVDFWAQWCGPCRMVAPHLDAIAQEFQGKAKVCKVDVDTEQQLAIQYGVQSIPLLLFFKNGQVADSQLGAVPKQAIVDKLNALL